MHNCVGSDFPSHHFLRRELLLDQELTLRKGTKDIGVWNGDGIFTKIQDREWGIAVVVGKPRGWKKKMRVI